MEGARVRVVCVEMTADVRRVHNAPRSMSRVLCQATTLVCGLRVVAIISCSFMMRTASDW